MLKEAIEKILEINAPETFEISNHTYATSRLYCVSNPQDTSPMPLTVSTLQAIVYFVATQTPDNKTWMIHVVDPAYVAILGPLQPSNENKRFIYAQAECKLKSFSFGTDHEIDEFIGALQSQFVMTEDTEKLLAVMGNLANDQNLTLADDGIAQQIHVKTGITTKSKIWLENPLRLAPYRTFPEIFQPESYFILRINNKSGKQLHAKLLEADGGAWKVKAIEDIIEWLKAHLKGDISIIG